MDRYYVDFQTGRGSEYADTLEKAMGIAENNCSYTGKSIKIFEGEKEVASLPWCGCGADEDDIVTVGFGQFGYYGEWIFYY